MQRTEAGDWWVVGPDYEPGHIAFGFGERRPVAGGEELPLRRLTPNEATEIAAELEMWAKRERHIVVANRIAEYEARKGQA